MSVPPNKLGLFYLTALVIGNMIGSGIFLIPSSLASYGGMGLLGWMVSCCGALILSFIFGKLSVWMPSAAGGPYEYTKQAFGMWPAYLVAWCYWSSIWFANAAIVVALLGYLSVLFPVIAKYKLLTISTGWFFIWGFTWINTKGIIWVGRIQLLTTLLKMIPLLLVIVLGSGRLFSNLHSIPVEFNFTWLTSAIALTFFAFQGLESASIASDQSKGSTSVVLRATFIGTLVTSCLYLASNGILVMLLQPAVLGASTSPFADASEIFLGPFGRYVIALGAVISTCGALNGWTLIQGHIPMAAAQDGLFPRLFQDKNASGSPVKGVVITSGIVSILLVFNYVKELVSLFTMMISLSTLAVLVPYFFSMAAYSVICYKKDHYVAMIWPFIATLFLLWVCIGCGLEITLYGISFIVLGIFFKFVWSTRNANE